MQLDTMKLYVESRLRSWAYEIRGGRENLDFPSINLLSKDWNPSTGVRRTGISDEAWETETIVNEIFLECRDAGLMLRAVYLGHGRFAEERRQAAERALRRKLSRYKFWALFHDAFDRACIYFNFLAKTS